MHYLGIFREKYLKNQFKELSILVYVMGCKYY